MNKLPPQQTTGILPSTCLSVERLRAELKMILPQDRHLPVVTDTGLVITEVIQNGWTGQITLKTKPK